MHQPKPSLTTNNSPHQPVMLAEVLGLLTPQKGESYLDLTGGFGGHASGVLEGSMAPRETVLVDRDANAVSHLRESFGGQGVQVVRSDFRSASEELAREGRQFDLVLADLGVSSQHLNQSERGFAFAEDGPLDMRMDRTAEPTAATLVNTLGEGELVNLIMRYGEERWARRIARAIVRARRRAPLRTTQDLAVIITQVIPPGARPPAPRRRPAARTRG
jgi:16S rRNA (cytosine1402-N4)-methyltransferase